MDEPGIIEAKKRLLQSWRAEIEARAVYQALADREKDPRRAEVLRRMADSEGGHRTRLEERMTAMGIAIPDATQVNLPLWKRLQVLVAPVDRVLVMQEKAEESEITDRYLRPTGDAQTDELLGDIRKDERSHSSNLSAMAKARGPHDSNPSARLNQILSRESWHQTGSGWISGAIYGANDGLAAVFGIVSGVSGATSGSSFVLTAGLAGALASALSMATGAYLAERSVAEVSEANLEQERREIEENPEEEREEASLYFQLKGLSVAEADQLAIRLAADGQGLLDVMAAEELGGVQGGGNPVQASVAAGLSTAVGAIVPVLPFFWVQGTAGVIWAAAVSLVAHFLVGAAKSLVTLSTWWRAGLEMTAAGVIVGGFTYVAGLLFHA